MNDVEAPADGRVARRERNINSVLDVVLEMFAEESLFPTIEQVAKRSGLSLRSLYRYFADPAELLEAVIVRSREQVAEAVLLPAIGQGFVADRIDDFVAMRLRLHEISGPTFRATMANAAHHPRVAAELASNRELMRDQFVLQFAPELEGLSTKEREHVLNAGDLLTQLDAVDFLRRHRQLSADDTHAVVAAALGALFR
jgi:AcrR family transcriptional regulator